MSGQADIVEKLKELNALTPSTGYKAEWLRQELHGVNRASFYRNLRVCLKNGRVFVAEGRKYYVGD